MQLFPQTQCRLFPLVVAVCALFWSVPGWAAPAEPTQAELGDFSIDGGVTNGKARLVIQAMLKGLPKDKQQLVYVSALQHRVQVAREKLTHRIQAAFDILQGEADEIELALSGEGTIKEVTGKDLLFWSLREGTNGSRSLVLLPARGEPPKQFTVEIIAETELPELPAAVDPLTLGVPKALLFQGYVRVLVPADLSVRAIQPAGLRAVDLDYLPKEMQAPPQASGIEPLAFRMQSARYALPLEVTRADPETRQVMLRDFRLTGQLSESNAAFTLVATAVVRNPEGGQIDLLAGNVALTEVAPGEDWRLNFNQGRFVFSSEQAGTFPVQLQFNAAVRPGGGWNRVEFRVAPAALQPITLGGLAPDTQFQFAGAAKPERSGDRFASYLPPDGQVKLAWKEARPEAEGRLFYSAEMLAQISVSPGLMRQAALFEGKVMQGELTRVTLQVSGDGEVTRVQGDQVLAWNVELVPNSTDRRLVVQFNQPQKDQFAFQVHSQTPLGAFPQTLTAVQLRPEEAIRFAGYVRIVNEGAVRLEVVQSSGLSQISPEQFPESDVTRALFGTPSGQRFAFRFSSTEFQLQIQADNILPELTVSEVLAYHLGEREQIIDAEIELDIREAPLRELVLLVPRGYALAGLSVPNMSDYFLTEPGNAATAELRVVYGQPTAGRQVLQVRLERNQPPPEPTWSVPRVEVAKAKSTRGQIGISADAGFRLTPESTTGLTELATAFFPKRVAGLQSAFRVSDPNWSVTLRVERLPQSIQADVFHLFSIGEGVAYGSSTINYLISGAPIGSFRVELSDEYFNVEFTGKDIRNWQKVAGGYQVQLHTPVAGAYTLLGTYERPFRSQGDTLTFTGARPINAQSEQGHTIVISAFQFQVQPVSVSPGLLLLEPGEVPSEYRLFFDAPVLAAYRYTARPFNLQLALSPLTQGETLSQVVDRAALVTRISKEGQVITDASYFVKNRGQPSFRMALPPDTQLWSATVNGATVVPVQDRQSNLIPLPQRSDPNAVIQIEVKLAARSKSAGRVTVAAPIVAAPVMLAEWKFAPDTGQRLVYRDGTLTPAGGMVDVSGFAGVARMLEGRQAVPAILALLGIVIFVALAGAAWRWSSREGVTAYSVRHLAGAAVGFLSFGVAVAALLLLAEMAEHQNRFPEGTLTFLAPVQQADSTMTVTVANLDEEPSVWRVIGRSWPAVLALVVWGFALFTRRAWLKPVGWILGWTLLAWAALRWPNGAPAFFGLFAVFLIIQLVIPAVRRWWQVPRKPRPTPPPPPTSAEPGSASPAVALLLCGGLLALSMGNAAGAASDQAAAGQKSKPLAAPIAQSVLQQIRVADEYAFAAATIRWQAEPNQQLAILREPAVLTALDYPTNALKLLQLPGDARRSYVLVAREAGTFEIKARYQLHVTQKDGQSGLTLPTQHGLVNEVRLALEGREAEIVSPQAVLIQPDPTAAVSNTVARLVLAPVNDAWIGWQPRSRDLKREKAEFYTEIFQLYVPTAGVIEGIHQAQIRPARGELSEVVFEVPPAATITDVIDPATLVAQPDGQKSARSSIVSLWRFDPDTRKLRVSLSPPQSRSFALTVLSQVATGPLPFQQTVGLVTITNAAGQPIGLVGVATGSDVQLEEVTATALSPINLEDFPDGPRELLAPRIAGLTLRRAFRYADAQATVALDAAPVEPDVRVTTRETLSLGEDRILLAANVDVVITRAGIFRLSFVLPEGLDVESVSSPVMSHWTDLRTPEGRIITLHLKGKTEGQHQFSISLSGPGVKTANAWPVPRLLLREATKQRGQLVVVPEQGLRLQVAASEGVAPFDPQEAGIRQKGILGFRILQTPWSLALDLEQVPPWIQVTSLQHATLTEAQVKVAANLQYQIDNTGLKAFHVRIPTNAEGVRFTGEQVSDFLPVAGGVADDLQEWEIKLHRRVIGKYLLQLAYQVPLPGQATNLVLRGPQAVDADTQRGFLTIQSGDRLEVRALDLPIALQPAEWQSIPRGLLQGIADATANLSFRLLDSGFRLPLALERREAARLLPARVNSLTLTSVISDDGVMLTHVTLNLLPGDKRLLHLNLPRNARFWFAFVNQNGVWPWTTATNILIPLEQQSRAQQAIEVEFFYSSQVGAARPHALDLELLGPKFDLPLENITWHVYLNEKWELDDWNGTLQLQEEKPVAQPVKVDVQSYLRTEANRNQEKTREAEQMLQLGNSYLEKGDPQQARRAFQAAYGLSAHDDAFNEDARVQLHNLKLQQALVGLNVRQATVVGEGDAAGKVKELRARKGGAYTQDEARQIIDSNSAEENAAFMKLAERLIQQQNAAAVSPTAIRANIPEQGRLLTFRRAVEVNRWADMRIELEADAVQSAAFGTRFLLLLGTAAVFGLGLGLARWLAVKREARAGE